MVSAGRYRRYQPTSRELNTSSAQSPPVRRCPEPAMTWSWVRSVIVDPALRVRLTLLSPGAPVTVRSDFALGALVLKPCPAPAETSHGGRILRADSRRRLTLSTAEVELLGVPGDRVVLALGTREPRSVWLVSPARLDWPVLPGVPQ